VLAHSSARIDFERAEIGMCLMQLKFEAPAVIRRERQLRPTTASASICGVNHRVNPK
jgi:hypothetical protein